ncbi:MAG: GNAT family N-acetyltransferase [Alphaproteobacteria bacterium]|nr:GNAT family N-acetyltransferase [Alphaproteobacteria bacterium]
MGNLSIIIDKQHRRKGLGRKYCPDVIKDTLKPGPISKNELKYNTLIWITNSTNEASIKLGELCGFKNKNVQQAGKTMLVKIAK